VREGGAESERCSGAAGDLGGAKYFGERTAPDSAQEDANR